MTPDKAAMRVRLRAKRDSFTAGTTNVITPPAEFLALLGRGLTVASYVAIGSEADPVHLMFAALEKGCSIALPHVISRAAPLRFLAWDGSSDLVTGPFGLRQPADDAPDMRPDIVLTPLIGFDHALNRLGQGAGHYDRAFADLPRARRIGVAWSVQQLDALQVDSWDIPLHAIITECGWMTKQ